MARGTLKRSQECVEAAVLRRVLGVGPDDPVEVVTPQFEREPNWPGPAAPPADAEAWAALSMLDRTALRELGLRPWGRKENAHGQENGPTLYLFPGEWYHAIPAGFEVVDIMFDHEAFVPGVTDDDIRFGCLAYGILAEEP